MANITTQRVSLASDLVPTYTAAVTTSQTFRPGDRVFLHVRNLGTASATLTVDDVNSQSPAGATQFNPDVVIVTTAQASALRGPFPAGRFASSATGLASLTWSSSGGMSIAVLSL